jgi:protein-export membrane protein SecD
LGLDLHGGSQLVYQADTAALAPGDVGEAMSALREVIDRRVNAFGVAEPLVQVETAGFGAVAQNRLVVELPGVTDIKQAIAAIGVTPELDFRVLKSGAEETVVLDAPATSTFVRTGLTGRFLKRATVEFGASAAGPSISLEFTKEGATRFAEITKAEIGRPVGIFLDNQLISAPTVRQEIKDGRAEISGQFTVAEAQALTRNLNLGSLPVPIKLISTETIGASLGEAALGSGVYAGLVGFLIVALFMILWYRLPGLVSVVSLSIYVVLMLAIFKFLPVTLTAAGIAGFILSVGMAVDANILIFERLKEELPRSANLLEALERGFSRAWFSIRDSNLSSIISALILFWFGTSLIKGFALTLAIGVVVSMLTAISITRTLLLALGATRITRLNRFLFSSGIFKPKTE